jgi:hypothetical protein
MYVQHLPVPSAASHPGHPTFSSTAYHLGSQQIGGTTSVFQTPALFTIESLKNNYSLFEETLPPLDLRLAKYPPTKADITTIEI